MYLVELRPGKEELYRTVDELALAIRNGDVDARSRIYHRATAKWISITLHPQYKAIVAGTKDEVVARPARKGWALLQGGHAAPEGSSPDAASSGANVLHRWRRPMGLGLSGLLLFLGIQLASSGPRPPWAGDHRPLGSKPRPAETVSTPAQGELVSLASTRTVWQADGVTATDTMTADTEAEVAPILPRAPRLRRKALRQAIAGEPASKSENLGSVDALMSRYDAASEVARTRLESGMRVAQLGRLFAASRLSPGGGVPDTRLSLAGAANFIRVYRQQQGKIEEAYQDSVTLLAKRYGWTAKEIRRWNSRTLRQEPPALEVLSTSLFSGIDSLLGVLDAQAGAYKIRGTAIAFEDPAAAKQYGALRQRIREQIDGAVAAGGATLPGPTGFLLQAIGTSTLPRET